MSVTLEAFEQYFETFKTLLHTHKGSKINEKIKTIYSDEPRISILLEKFLQGKKLFHNEQHFLEASDEENPVVGEATYAAQILKEKNYRMISLEEASNIFEMALRHRIYRLMNIVWDAWVEAEQKEDKRFSAYYLTDTLEELTTILNQPGIDLNSKEILQQREIVKAKLDVFLKARVPRFTQLWKDYPLIKELYFPIQSLTEVTTTRLSAYRQKLYSGFLELARSQSPFVMNDLLEDLILQDTLKNISAYFSEAEILEGIEAMLAKHKTLRSTTLTFLLSLERTIFDKKYESLNQAIMIAKQKSNQLLSPEAQIIFQKEIKILEKKRAVFEKVNLLRQDLKPIIKENTIEKDLLSQLPHASLKEFKEAELETLTLQENLSSKTKRMSLSKKCNLTIARIKTRMKKIEEARVCGEDIFHPVLKKEEIKCLPESCLIAEQPSLLQQTKQESNKSKSSRGKRRPQYSIETELSLAKKKVNGANELSHASNTQPVSENLKSSHMDQEAPHSSFAKLPDLLMPDPMMQKVPPSLTMPFLPAANQENRVRTYFKNLLVSGLSLFQDECCQNEKLITWLKAGLQKNNNDLLQEEPDNRSSKQTLTRPNEVVSFSIFGNSLGNNRQGNRNEAISNTDNPKGNINFLGAN